MATIGVSPPKSILTISLSKHLTGKPISEAIAADWSKFSARVKDSDNVGFNVDADHFDQTLQDLSETLRERSWDGVIVGWCLRGADKDRTVMFERIMSECVDAARANAKLKVMFCTGPDDIAQTTLRNFG